jgi:hypothetical protein
MFRMPNQSSDEQQKKEVKRNVRNNVFSFIGLIALIRTGNNVLTCKNSLCKIFFFFLIN